MDKTSHDNQILLYSYKFHWIFYQSKKLNKIFEQLGITASELKTWDSLYKNDLIEENAKVIEKGEPLFLRLDKDEELEYIKDGMKNG